MLKEKAAYAIRSRDQFGGGTEENKFFDCKVFSLDFQKKQHFPSKHKANVIVSLLRSTDLLTSLLLQSNNLVGFFLSISLTGKINCRFLSFLYYLDLAPPNSSSQPYSICFPGYTMLSHQPMVKTNLDKFLSELCLSYAIISLFPLCLLPFARWGLSFAAAPAHGMMPKSLWQFLLQSSPSPTSALSWLQKGGTIPLAVQEPGGQLVLTH